MPTLPTQIYQNSVQRLNWLVLAAAATGLAGCSRPQAPANLSDAAVSSRASGAQAVAPSQVSKTPPVASTAPSRAPSSASSGLSSAPTASPSKWSATPTISGGSHATLRVAPSALSGAARSNSRAGAVSPSTLKMAALLRRTAVKLNVRNLPLIVNDRRVELVRNLLAQSTSAADRGQLEWSLASELLYDGQNAECLKTVDDLERLAADNGIKLSTQDRDGLRMLRVQAYLRTGEMENCCALHNADSCLLPLQGGAIYQKTGAPAARSSCSTNNWPNIPTTSVPVGCSISVT